jgi:hypothetical protein
MTSTASPPKPFHPLIGETVCDVRNPEVRHGVFNQWIPFGRKRGRFALVIVPQTKQRYYIREAELAPYEPKE